MAEPNLDWPSGLPLWLRPWIEKVIVPILVGDWIKENREKVVAPEVVEVAECDLQSAVEVRNDRSQMGRDLRPDLN